MVNMVKADTYRTFRSIAIYVAFGIVLLLIGISLYLCEPGMISASMSAGGEDGEHSESELASPVDNLTLDEYYEMTTGERRSYIIDAGGYELDRDMMSTNMNLYYVFIFVAAIVITADFSAGTAKNTLSSAIGRGKYFASKTVVVFAISLLIFFANTYLTYFLNLLVNGSSISSSLWIMTRTALLQLPVALALVAILTGFAFMLKKTALYNVVTIPLMMVGQMLFGMVVGLADLPDKVMNYDFQTMLQLLAGAPSESYMAKCYILCGAVCAAFLAAGWLSFRRAEIR